MANQQLIDYVKQQIQGGVSQDTIKNALRLNDWKDGDINQVFDNLAAPANPIFKPRGVKVISILYLLGSLLVLGFGVLFLFGASSFEQVLKTGFFGKFFVAGGIFFIALGILGIFTGVGLWKYKNWARWIAIFIFLTGIIISIVSIMKGNVAINIFNTAVGSIICGYLFLSPKVKAAFEPEKNITPLNKKLLWVLAILLFLVAGVATVYGSRIAVVPDISPAQTPSPVQPVTISTPTLSSLGEPHALSPKEQWIKMNAEAVTIKSYVDLEAYTLKYGSKEGIAKLEANRKQIDALPQSFKDQIAVLAKPPLPNEITTIQETVNGDTATLNIQTIKPGLTGVITLVREDDVWKLELESWKQQ